MSNDKHQELHDAYIEYMKLLPEEQRDLEAFKVRLEKVNNLFLFFKDRYKKTNKISEFECAKKVKRIREIKIECENEVKRLDKSIAASEDYIFLYEDYFDPQEAQPTPQALAWASKNTWYGKVGHQDESSFALSTHYEIVKEGFIADSDDYYNELNRRVFEVYPELFVVELSARKN